MPHIFETNHQNPSCNSNYILYIKSGVLYGLKVGAQTNTREIDFEEDLWLHDCHHEFNTTDGSSGNKVVKLITFSELGGDDEDFKIKPNEEILIDYVNQVAANRFVVFPMRESVFVERGLIIDVDVSSGKIANIEKIPKPDLADGVELCRPGVNFFKSNGQLTDILMIGGNEARMSHNYNLEAKKWVKAGKLPDLHTVTEHINVQYEDQVLTVFVQVNFTDNCFQMMIGSNNGNVGANETEEQWKWLKQANVDIEYFHIKNAMIYENKLLCFGRGKPKGCTEICCSFILAMDIKTENGRIVDVETDKYTYVKVDQLSYAQYQSKFQINKKGNDLVIKVPQEDNYSEGFPRQLLEFTVPNGDLNKNHDLNDDESLMKIISVRFDQGEKADEKDAEEKKANE